MALLKPATLLVGGVGAILVYYIGLAIYRLYFHPLAKFPGPKLAALSAYYEFYYDVIKRGKFMWQIEEMHQQYGPIIRITPEELHVNDPDFYEELYGTVIKKRDKYPPWVALAGAPGATFATVGHDLHRVRRNALNPFFSKRAVTQLEPILQEKVNKLVLRFEQAMKTGQVFRADVAYTALTMDIICQYAFAVDGDHLMEDDFKLQWKEDMIGAFEAAALMRQFPWMLDVMKAMPPSWLIKGNPGMKLILQWQEDMRARIKPIFEKKETAEDLKKLSHRTIFHEMRDSNLPASERTIDRFADEAQILTGAGTETTAAILTNVNFYLLQNKEDLKKLKDELATVMPTPTSTVPCSVLEQLPFLSAIVSEGMRISIGASTRLPRVAPDEIMQYREWAIPAGTPVSESTYFILMNPTIFPSPSSFLPSRWILDSKYNRAMDKHLVNFGRGPRQCIGMNLAYAELYLTIAAIYRRFEMELFETTIEDVKMAHDFFGPVPRLDSKGVRTVVTGEAKS